MFRKEARVHTVPYTMLLEKLGTDARLDCDVIVGVETREETLWQLELPKNPAQILPSFNREQARETVIPLKGHMRGLPDFFKAYLLQRGHGGSRDFQTYDCHFFAQSMSSESGPYHTLRRLDLTESLANRALRGAALAQTARLGLGQVGIFGFKAYAEDGPVDAQHSVIGLGEESDACLQVIGRSGPLAMSGLGEALEFYRIPPVQDPSTPIRKYPFSKVDIAGRWESAYAGRYGLYLPE